MTMTEKGKPDERANLTNGKTSAGVLESEAFELAASREERLRLIRAFQTQAMKKSDPLAANLDVISGDLMLFAFRMREIMEKDMMGALTTERGFQQFERQSEVYLKFIRQLDRLAQIERHRATVTQENSP
jgi:hypothetical protein